MHFIFLILSLLGYFVFFNKRLKTSYSVSIPFSTALIISVLYIAALLRALEATVYSIYILGAALFIYCTFEEYKNKKSILTLFPKELLLLLSVIFLYYLRISPSYYISWDDFTHWAIASKEINFYNGLHAPGDLTSIYPNHFNYTRIPAIFNYFLTKSIGYSEGNNMFANGLLCILFSSVVLIPGRIWQSLLLFFGVLAAGILYTPILRSLYIDGIVGIVFGAIISIYIQEDKKFKALFYILPILFILPNIKEVGFWLAYAAIITIFIDLVIRRELKGYSIAYIMFLFAVPYISHKLWVNYLLNFNVISPHTSFSLKVYFNTFLNLFNSEQSKEVLVMFIKTLPGFAFKEGSFVIYTLLALLIYLYKKHKSSERSFLVISCSLLVLFAYYLSFRLFIWLYHFPITDTVKAASYIRYYASFAIVFVFVITSFIKLNLLRSINKDIKLFNRLIVTLAIIFITIVSFNLYKRPPLYFDKDREISLSAALPLAALQNNGLRVMTIFNNITQFNCTQIIYELAPYGTAEDLQACRRETINSWPNPYRLNKTFSINLDMFNDDSNSVKDPTKYDVLYITNLDKDSEQIITKALNIKDSGREIFIKKDDKFVAY